MEEINLNGKTYVLKEEISSSNKDENGNINCNGCVNTHNSTGCNNSTECDNSTWCDNSTRCDNSTYLIYCSNLVLEKFMVFNNQLKNKNEFKNVKNKIVSQLGYYKHPKNLTKGDIKWLRDNIGQFDEEVLKNIIEDSILPDKPREI